MKRCRPFQSQSPVGPVPSPGVPAPAPASNLQTAASPEEPTIDLDPDTNVIVVNFTPAIPSAAVPVLPAVAAISAWRARRLRIPALAP